MTYNKKIVSAYLRSFGIPEPEYEYKFHPDRKWRFDLAWPPDELDYHHPRSTALAVECDGGIWIGGGHNRGAQIKKTWEKENEANCLGWHILKCEPSELCTVAFAETIKRALGL